MSTQKYSQTFYDAYQWVLSLANIPRKEYMSGIKTGMWHMQRFRSFLTYIDNPENHIPHYIHVTGTSGKGSTTSFLHSILQVAGHYVGSTYSPHPTHILERWRVNDRYMTEQEFVAIVDYLKPRLDAYIQETQYDMISFFELTEAIGFLFFTQQKVTHVVVEVACGGRYDSSNVIPHKDIAIITNIGRDHIGIIGNNTMEIAYEKAGIITSKTHVITGEKNPRLARVIQKEAAQHRATYHRIHKPIYTITATSTKGTTFTYDENTYRLPIFGIHQIHNAILCIEAGKHLNISPKHIAQGLQQVTQPLRMEIVQKKPLVILDGAHNEDKIATTVHTTQSIQKVFNTRHTYLILGFSEDKSVNQMLKKLLYLKPKMIIFTRNTSNHLRKVADMRQMETYVKKHAPKIKTTIHLDPYDAYLTACTHAKNDDLILATGSIFMTGEIRGKIR